MSNRYEVISLPIGEHINKDDILKITNLIKNF